MQNVLSSRILPAFKRYSIGTEPVREAAKVCASISALIFRASHLCLLFQFWTSFYEHAAQVRIPTSDDLSGAATEDPHMSSLPEDSLITSGSSANTFDPNRTPSDSSFIPAHAAVSSTPAAATARIREMDDTSPAPLHPVAEPSWGMSIESPLVRLDRELRDFARADPQPASTSASIDLFSEADITVSNANAVAADVTVQASALGPAPVNTREPRTTMQTQVVSPLSVRPNPATPARNPYLPAHADPRDWSGIIDLRSQQAATSSDTDKEDDLTLPVGMSPPVMVPFATLPSLGRSPAKSAATTIRHALVRDVLRAGSGDPSVSGSGSGGVAPTPPSLTRYTRDSGRSHSSSSLGPDLELESIMRRVELPKNPQDWWQSSATSASASSTSILDNTSLSTPSYYTTPAPAPAYAPEATPELPETPLPPSLSSGVAPLAAAAGEGTETGTTSIEASARENDDTFTSTSTSTFSSSGEDDSVHNTAHPSAAFLLASRQRGRHDYGDHDDERDDGDDDFDDSLLDADVDADAAAAARAPVHPFARVQAAGHDNIIDYDDDSFDSFDGGSEGGDRPEETVFGVRPAEREAAQPRLRLFGEDLLQDTIGIGTQLARAGRIEESPTPWGGGSGGRGG